MSRFPLPTIITAAALVLVLVAYAFSYQVRFSQFAVKTHLGQADDNSIHTDPGIKFRWPWPIEEVQVYDKRLQTIDTPEGETKTRDGKNLIVGCFAVWKIDADSPGNALKFYKVSTTERKAESQLRARINEARQLVIGRHDMSDLFGLDEEQVRANHDKIEKEMLDAAAADIQKDYGIVVTHIGIRRISLPDAATQEVFKSMSKERDALATKYRSEGESLAKSIESRAQSASDQIMAFTMRKAEEIKSEGRRAATTYLSRIEQQDREFFIFLREMETMESMLKQRATIFFDTTNEFLRKFVAPEAPKSRSQSSTAPDAHQ